MNEDTRSAARAIIDRNLYMVLATVGADGAPWASPVFYSTEDGTASPLALYLRATAEELHGEEALEGLRVISGPAGRGGRSLAREEARAPVRWRVYRARVSEYSMICPRGNGRCAEHGLDHEHRTTVRL